MPDPYEPGLDTFEFTQQEQAVIEQAMATAKPWDWKPKGELGEAFKAIKNRIREFHLVRHNHRCCYCRRDLKGGGHFMIDREHVLPKSIEAFKLFAFTKWNLGASCKRCNMEYKGSKIDFVVTTDDADVLQDGANYRFIHPNFDRYKDHISRVASEDDDIVVVRFTKKEGSEKGAFTYDYFNLAGLEREILDEAQGAPIVEEPSEAGYKVRLLADNLGQ
ncbi:HNH endonuclease [Sphingomonas sp. TREG-RG-20F-R18-01]|uniref:HNH endonuclease n=1 Tax=Sphingomonas sp. TREG-RG-20F-R18-01 TaxID=2914982 RepID=UPI001F56A355|nr:HNH endonuclease [Sphingomonas sp. TREG-RG-20F-R18-01]